MEKLDDRFRYLCSLTHYDTRSMRQGAEIAFDLLLKELAALVRRHGPGDCVDFAHVTALMDQIMGDAK